MPKLNLSKLVHRDPTRPTIRERAAALKASASRAIRRRPTPVDAISDDAAAAILVSGDAALLLLEGEFQQADLAHAEANAAFEAAKERYVEPPMPGALRVWRNDWINPYLPRTCLFTREGREGLFASPYGKVEVEQIRGLRCRQPAYGRDGELQPDGTRDKPDPFSQERVDGIVSAWDAWQAAITAAKAELQLSELSDMADAAYDRRYAILVRVLEIPAVSLAGLGVKARIAGARCGNADVKAYGLETYGASEEEALPFDITGDVLTILNGAETIYPDADLIALGRQFEEARLREGRAQHEAGEREERAYARKPQRPECLIFRREDHGFHLRRIHEHADALAGSKVTQENIEWMTRHPLKHQVLRPVQSGEREWRDYPGHVPEMVPFVEAQARADEIVTAWAAWHAEIGRVNAEEGVPEAEEAATAIYEEMAAIARRIAETPAQTIEGMRLKVRALSFFEGYVDQTEDLDSILTWSLLRDAGVEAEG